MKLKIWKVLLLSILTSSFAQAQQRDVIDSLATYFNNSNAAKIAAYFPSAVELNILGDEDSYSKAQAELILRSFLSKNKPNAVKVIHRLTSNPNYKVAVLSMQTDQSRFRVAISLSSNQERFLVRGIRIQNDKQ